jgi:hypothetical protein
MSNFLFDLKIKELKCLNKKYIIENDTLYEFFKDNLVLVGCVNCYMVQPEITNDGYKIPAGDLINYYEKFNEMVSCPVEIARNCWLCPHCSNVFKNLIPEIDFIEVINVSI